LALGGVYVLYAGTWSALTLGASALAAEARLALMCLLGCWIASVVLLPRMAPELAQRAHPLPAAGAFWATVAKAQEKGIDGHQPQGARTIAFRERILAEHGVETVAELPFSFTGLSLQAGEENGNRIFDHYYGELHRQEQRQLRAIRWFGLGSPAVALRALSSGFAGTDLAHHATFTAHVEQHRRDLQGHLNGDFARNAKGREFNYRADTAFWGTLPAFTHGLPRLSAMFAHYRADLAVLLAWCAAASGFFVLAARRLGRKA